MKESETIDNYLDLARELKKLKMIPVVVGAFRMVPKSFEKRLRELKIRGRIETIQKSPGYLKRLAVTQTSEKNPQLNLL